MALIIINLKNVPEKEIENVEQKKEDLKKQISQQCSILYEAFDQGYLSLDIVLANLVPLIKYCYCNDVRRTSAVSENLHSTLEKVLEIPKIDRGVQINGDTFLRNYNKYLRKYINNH